MATVPNRPVIHKLDTSRGKMKQNASGAMAGEIMTEFAEMTGLSPAGRVLRRYLWTDAFAVCNFLELYRQRGDEKYKHLALRLVDQVHHTLGRHREDDPRTGWISGLDEREGKRHPTKGGLRIGKEMNERRPADPFDERLEWDRDGQYYHYLTKWMHALNRVSRVTDDPLGIGGLLSDAYKVAQLIRDGYFEQTHLLEILLDSSLPGLESYAKKNPWKLPADYRLAFRELGLSIGLRAFERLQELVEENPGLFDEKPPLPSRIASLMQYKSFSEGIEMFWLENANREANSWIEHRDINMVMLATSLAPDGYLTL